MPFNDEHGGGFSAHQINGSTWLLLAVWSYGGDAGSNAAASLALAKLEGNTLQIVAGDGHSVWYEIVIGIENPGEQSEALTEGREQLKAWREAGATKAKILSLEEGKVSAFSFPAEMVLALSVSADRGYINYPG